MSTFLLLLFTILIFLFIEGFLSGSEIAMVAADRKRLGRLRESSSWGSRLTAKILEEPSWFLATALVGSNLAEVTNAVLVTAILIGIYGVMGDIWASLLLTPLVLVIGEILPKTLFQQKADRWVEKIVPVIWVLSLVLFPLVWFMSRCTSAVSRSLRQEVGTKPFVTREELQLLLETEGGHGDLKPMEKDMIHRIFRLPETRIKEVMIPLVNVVSLEENASIVEAIDSIRQESYSRYPVFRERVDNIVGILHSFDLLFASEDGQSIQGFIRPVSYFPETKPVDEMLVTLKRTRETMAVVVDEYGGAVGIVTIEDILEEVVGEIQDEFDIDKPLYRKVASKKYWINARMEIDHINEILQLNLPRGDYETLGGFLLERLGHVPLAGESCRYRGMLLEVKAADEKSVREVLVTVKE
jgi:putative hemolysin